MDDNQIIVPPSFIALFVPEGRIRPTETREHIQERYELCEDLAQMLDNTARDRMLGLGISADDALERLKRGLDEGTLVTPDEANWVIRRVEELLGG